MAQCNAIRADHDINILKVKDHVYNEPCTTIDNLKIEMPQPIELSFKNNESFQYFTFDQCKHSSSMKHMKKLISNEDKNILSIEIEPICPKKSNDTLDSLSNINSHIQSNLIGLMKQIYKDFKSKTNNIVKTKSLKNLTDHPRNQKIYYQSSKNQYKKNDQNIYKFYNSKKNISRIIEILPYENTYQQFYYPNNLIDIERTLIDDIIQGVQSMATTLTNKTDVEDILNGSILLSNHLTSLFANRTNSEIIDELINTLQKRFTIHDDAINREQIRVRTALNLILADNRLNGITILSQSDALLLSSMLRKIVMCTQLRTLCSYVDVSTTINDNNLRNIHLHTYERMSVSSDEFIEIIGEMYESCYEIIQTAKYYLDAIDVVDIDTNLIRSSILDTKQIDNIAKYISYEDSIRQLIKLLLFRKNRMDKNSNTENVQFQLILPMKLDELYQPIKKLSTYMSTNQVRTAIKQPYLAQLIRRSKMKQITVYDLYSINSQICLTSDNLDKLLAEKAITSEVLCQYYIDFHEIEDIDERLNKIKRKIDDYANLHNCITRVLINMIAENVDGTSLTPYLSEFNKSPCSISIVDMFDELIKSGLISTTELILNSKQDIIIKKSSLLKHFERISYFRKRDADVIAEKALVMRIEDLIELLTQRALIMKQAYINCILSNDERKDFLEKHINKSTQRLSSLSIHKFIHYFNLKPNVGKIFYWMNLTDENIVKTLIEIKTFVNEYTLGGIYKSFLKRFNDTLESGVFYVSVEYLINLQEKSLNLYENEKTCQYNCFLTYEQASILVDFADPQYENELQSLITKQDVISYENFQTLLKFHHNNAKNIDQLSKFILVKQDVIQCKILLNSFDQRITYRQRRFERIENLQRLLLSSTLLDRFIEVLADVAVDYFTRTELDYLQQIRLIDSGIFSILFSFPFNDRSMKVYNDNWVENMTNVQEMSNQSSNYLHVLDPIIEKYSVFLTKILIKLIANKDRYSIVNEYILSNIDQYLSIEEILQVCFQEQLLKNNNIQQICQEVFHIYEIVDPDIQYPYRKMSTDTSLKIIDEKRSRKSSIFTSNSYHTNEIDQGLSNNHTVTRTSSIFSCYDENIAVYANDPVKKQELNERFMLIIFDYLLHFNHRTSVNLQLRQLLKRFKPLPVYKAQMIIEREMVIIKLLLKNRKRNRKLSINDLNRYLESYPIPCRLDIVNELRRSNIVSQYLTDKYTMDQCHQLKSSSPEIQSIFIFYMMIKLIRNEGYIDENSLNDLLHQYSNENIEKKLNQIYQQILSQGFLSIDQIIQSTKAFFLNDYFNQDIFDNKLKECKSVINKEILFQIFQKNNLTNVEHEPLFNRYIRRRDVISINVLNSQLNQTKIAKEKIQRQVDNVLLQYDDNLQTFSTIKRFSSLGPTLTNETTLNLRSLRHHYIQSRIAPSELHLLVEKLGLSDDVYLEFKRELDIINSNNSLEIIKYITYNISLLLKENGSIDKQILMKYFQQHDILFFSDFQLLLTRYGMVALDDLVDLLVISRLATIDQIKVYEQNLFALNINKFMEISNFNEDILVKKYHVENNLEKQSCITLNDVSQLLNHVLKLDRLKEIFNIMPLIKTYMNFHPINTYNSLKAFQLEFDFNHHDMKFLHDLNIINDIFYKQYLLSRTSETERIQTDSIENDEEQQDNVYEFHAHSNIDDDIEFDMLNDLFDNQQLSSHERYGQNYIARLKNRAEELLLYKSKAFLDHEQNSLAFDLNETLSKEIKPRIIEQLFPEPSNATSQFLIPYFSDDQNRKFLQLDYAEEQNINQYYTNLHDDDQNRLENIKKLHLNSDKSRFKTSAEILEDSTNDTQTIRDSKINKQLVTSNTLESSNDPENRLNYIDDLSNESFEQNILIENIKTARSVIAEWLKRIRESNEQILKVLQTTIDIGQCSIVCQSSATRLINYLENELKSFIENVLPKFNNSEFKDLFQNRINSIEYGLRDLNNHMILFRDIGQLFLRIKNEFNAKDSSENLTNQYKIHENDFSHANQREYMEIQPWLRTQIHINIQTFDNDLELIENNLSKKAKNEIIEEKNLVTQKLSFKELSPFQNHDELTYLRNKFENFELDLQLYRIKNDSRKLSKDLITNDINERLQNIREEYLKQRKHEKQNEFIRINIDKLDEFNSDQSIEYLEKANEIHNLLKLKSNEIQQDLTSINVARNYSNNPNLVATTKLKMLRVDKTGNFMRNPLYLIDEQNLPISDELKLIRMPNEFDRFKILGDKTQLIIVDQNDLPISDQITFKKSEGNSIEFEYIDTQHRTVYLSVDGFTRKTIHFNIKEMLLDEVSLVDHSIDKELFIVHANNEPLSKPIRLIDEIDSSIELAIFLYDEQTNEQVRLTSQQYLITIEQAEFSSRKYKTYVINKNQRIISQSIELNDNEIKKRHLYENIIINQLINYDRQCDDILKHLDSIGNENELLINFLYEYDLINFSIQDRLVKLKTEEKIIEQIVPILYKNYNNMSTDYVEYKNEQSNLDHLLNTMKSIVELDEQLRTTKHEQTSDELEIKNKLINQLIRISVQLDDQSVFDQVQKIRKIANDSQIFAEIRSIIINAIRNKVKSIQIKCENLLLNIQKQTNQFKQTERVRFEYVHYLIERFKQEDDNENNINCLYDKIERMQYDFHHKLVDSLRTLTIDELKTELKNNNILNQIEIPDHLKSENEKLIYIFHTILRLLNNRLKMIENDKNNLIYELEEYLVNANINENSYIDKINLIQNEIKINENEKLLLLIEKFKVLLNKLESINDSNSLYYNFLLTKFDYFYDTFINNYHMKLSSQMDIRSIFMTLNNLRKTIKKDVQHLYIKRNELQSKLTLIKTNEQLKQQTDVNLDDQENQLSSLNAYLQQSKIEPINIHHEFYAMKIQEIVDYLINNRNELSADKYLYLIKQILMNFEIYKKILAEERERNEQELKHLEERHAMIRTYSLIDSVIREQIEDLTRQQYKQTRYQQSIINIQNLIHEAFNRFHSIRKLNQNENKNDELFQQLKQIAIDKFNQTIEYEYLRKHVSPHLLQLHKFTSGQELISLTKRSTVNLFQIEIAKQCKNESVFETHLVYDKKFQQQSSENSNELKKQILQNEINYLEKQRIDASSTGDLTKYLAIEQIILSKFHQIEHNDDDHEREIKLDEPKIVKTSSNIDRETSGMKQNDKKIRRLLKRHIKGLQKAIQSKEMKLVETPVKTIIDSVENLRRWYIDLKRFTQENDRKKQIQIQLQILDELVQSNKGLIDMKLLENIRQDLYKEQEQYQNEMITSSIEQLQIETLPISLENIHSSLIISQEQHQTIVPTISKMQLELDSKEQIRTAPITDNTNDLYQQFQQIRFSIQSNINDVQMISQVPLTFQTDFNIKNEQDNQIYLQESAIYQEIQSNVVNDSFELTKSTSLKLIDTETLSDDHITSMSRTDDIKKYSIKQIKANERQIEKPIERMNFQTERNYGNIYIRNRFVNQNIDKEQETLQKSNRSNKRLVDYVKTEIGNTVIHRRVNLSANKTIVPQRTGYEKYFQSARPLIYLNNVSDSPSSDIESISKQSSPINDHDQESNLSTSIFHRSMALSPIEEETLDDITFQFINQSLTEKQKSNESFKQINEVASIIDDETTVEKKASITGTLSHHSSQDINKPISQIKSKSSKMKKPKKKTFNKLHKHIQSIVLDEFPSSQDFEKDINTPMDTIMPTSTVVYHRIGPKGKMKRERLTDKVPVHLQPRKAVPFTSINQDEEINVEDDRLKKMKKKKRHTKSLQSNIKRRKKRMNIDNQTQQAANQLDKNQVAINKHLLNVKRFLRAPGSALDMKKIDKTDDIHHDRPCLNHLKPMVKNFQPDNNINIVENKNKLHYVNAYDLDKELFDFNNDTKPMDQPAIFTEYIEDFFQKQAEEKHNRRVSLTAVPTDEYLIKRLAPRTSRLYNGWQPNDSNCAHTNEFRPLKKYLMTDLAYYFDDNFVDETGLFKTETDHEKNQTQTKQTTQRFRDDFIVKEFFNCWKKYSDEKARIAELRRKHLVIDFREYWFQDALSNPFYSYFSQSSDYQNSQNHYHQMAYRLHKRLVRTGREQPQETMNNVNRSSFLPILFNLPKTKLDRQISLTRRRQQIDINQTMARSIPLSSLITSQDDILLLIRERLQSIHHRNKSHANFPNNEFILKELILNSSLLKQGSIEDLDRLIENYYLTQNQSDISRSSNHLIRLPPIKRQSSILKSNSKLSDRKITITK